MVESAAGPRRLLAAQEGGQARAPATGRPACGRSGRTSTPPETARSSADAAMPVASTVKKKNRPRRPARARRNDVAISRARRCGATAPRHLEGGAAGRVRVDVLVDDLRRAVDLGERHRGPAHDVEHDAARVQHGRLEERRRDGGHGRVLRARRAPPRADADERGAGVLHDRAHVGEVHVDEAGLDDDLGHAHDALPQDVVRDQEGVRERRVGRHDPQELVVRHDDQRVDVALELLERRHGLARALPALEAEGLRHDAHGQRARAPRRLGHDGRGPAPRAAAHARRHEDQVRAPDHLLDVGAALDRRRPPHRGLAARAEPPRQHAPDVQAGAPAPPCPRGPARPC